MTHERIYELSETVREAFWAEDGQFDKSNSALDELVEALTSAQRERDALHSGLRGIANLSGTTLLPLPADMRAVHTRAVAALDRALEESRP